MIQLTYLIRFDDNSINLPAISLSSSSLICAFAASLCSDCDSLSAITVARDKGNSNSRGRSPTLPFRATLPCNSSDYNTNNYMTYFKLKHSFSVSNPLEPNLDHVINIRV